MSLKDVRIERRTIMVGDTDFAVRGLSMDILLGLINSEPEDVKEATRQFYQEAMGSDGEIKGDGISRFISILQRTLPKLTAKAIAEAADEPEMWETVKQLPAPKQIEALLAVAQLTFEEPEALKNFLANLSDLLGLLAAPTQTSERKIPSSGRKTSGRR